MNKREIVIRLNEKNEVYMDKINVTNEEEVLMLYAALKQATVNEKAMKRTAASLAGRKLITMDSYGKEKFRALRVMDYLQPINIDTEQSIICLDRTLQRINREERNKKEMAKAIASVMVDCTTALHMLGYEADDRVRIYGENYEENKAKGWYNDKP